MTVLIIEDEELTARKLQRLLGEIEPNSRVVGLLGSVEESVEWLQKHGPEHPDAPDLLLLDIELADGQSFEIFNRVTVPCPVIFTTAYNEFAIRAFRVNSIDYLLKPIREIDLRNALAKLRTMKQLLADPADAIQASLANLLRQVAPASTPMIYKERFLIRQGQRLFSVPIDEVAYFFVRNKLSFLKTVEGHEWMLDTTMDELVQTLDPKRFFRLNRQVTAQVNSVARVHLYFNGKLKVDLAPTFEDEVIVSREKATDLKAWLGG